jgi:magnesium transporter
MTIVAARRYRDGGLVDPALPHDCAPPEKSEFDWVGMVEPTREEIAEVQHRYGLHPLAIEDALSPRQAPKAEAYGSNLFVVARTAARGEGDTIAYGQTAIFLGKDFIVTVRQGSTRAHIDLRKDLEAKPERLAEGPDFVLHAMLDFVVDGYGPLLDGIDETVSELEEGAIGAFPDPDRIRRIFRLRRELRRFEGIAGQMEEMAAKLAKVEQPAIDPRARPWFRDVFDHAHRAVTRTRLLNDTLGSILEVAGLLEQSRTGAITRQLAAWAAILAVPTAIAGIYGMNFDFMPELTWRYGYFTVLAAIALICGLLFARFRRIGWL